MAISNHPPITVLKRPSSSRPSSTSRSGTSVTSKQFLRKTAKGKVQKVLREHYLRSDIPCGSAACTACTPFYALQELGRRSTDDDGADMAGMVPAKRRKLAMLSENGRKGHKKFKKPHYLVLDTNIVLHQIDLLESPHFGADLVVPQTVVEEVRARSLPISKRLANLINETDASGKHARGWVFANEACAATHVSSLPSTSEGVAELVNDRNDRAIRTVAKWYSQHLSQYGISAVLLSDDANNRRLALAEGIQASTTRDYVEGMPEEASVSLGDLVAAVGTGFDKDQAAVESAQRTASGSGTRVAIYDEYLSTGTLQAGIKSGALHQGVFRPNSYNFLEGSVMTSAFPKPVLLVGREAMNRSVDGDVVVVELLPESEWKAPTDEVIDEAVVEDDQAADSDAEEVDDDAERKEARAEAKERALAERKAAYKASERQPTGKVVGVLKRQWRPFVCHLDRASLSSAAVQASNSVHSVFATPVARGIPKIRLRTRQAAALAGQKFVVSLDRWDVASRFPEGHFVRALGAVESKAAEQESLLLEYDVPYRPFSKAVLDGLPEEGDKWVVPKKTETSRVWKGREDLRERVICSIDPPGCQDIDDALHARKLPNGNIEAGVRKLLSLAGAPRC